MNCFEMFMPTRVLFGAGQLNNLNKLNMPGKRALIVISNGKAIKENGYLSRLQYQLSIAKIDWSVFDKIEANPLKETVMIAANAAKISNCDFVIALGGGSVLDASKAIATMATNSGDLWDYVSGGTGSGKIIEKDPLPIVAITTTAGTGSEVDQWGVISNLSTNEKIGFGGDDRLFPVIAVVDPELMISVPKIFSAYQGFDALFHSVEVYIGKFSNLLSDMITEKAIKTIAENLSLAVNDGGNLKAREQVAFANTLSGLAMVVGCTTSEHSLEHALSAFHHDLPHGAGLIMISQAYFQHFIDKGACPKKFIELAKFMGNPNANKAQDFIVELEKLKQVCGVNNLKMSDYGIVKEEFLKMANNAKSTMGMLFKADPIELSTDDCINIYERSYK